MNPLLTTSAKSTNLVLLNHHVTLLKQNLISANVDLDVCAGDVMVTGYSVVETTNIGESFGKDVVETVRNRLSLETVCNRLSLKTTGLSIGKEAWRCALDDSRLVDGSS